jgi:hypothetical protein
MKKMYYLGPFFDSKPPRMEFEPGLFDYYLHFGVEPGDRWRMRT